MARRDVLVLEMFLLILLVLQCTLVVRCRKHELIVHDDVRPQFDVSTFGFLKGGSLKIHVTRLHFDPPKDINNSKIAVLGFTLDKTRNKGFANYFENQDSKKCMLHFMSDGKGDKAKTRKSKDESVSTVFFQMHFHNMSMMIEKRGSDFTNLTIYREVRDQNRTVSRGRRSADDVDLDHGTVTESVESEKTAKSSIGIVLTTSTQSTTTSAPTTTSTQTTTSANTTVVSTTAQEKSVAKIRTTELVEDDIIPIFYDPKKETYETYFEVHMRHSAEQGLYNLFFHNCGIEEQNKKQIETSVDFSIRMVEVNGNNYLSAGEIPLPTLYFTLSVAFAFMGLFWLYVLRNTKDDVFKMHYVMLVLVFVKAASMLLHAINYHYIAKQGKREETFAILWYITYLIRGTLLFVTILLIGTGWAFIKHMLSDRDKKIFVVVIPLQILSNVAQIIIEETEEGQLHYTMWKLICFMVDLVCCGAILLPVIWSIRHLQEASTTDGKAAISLAKLKIFRHFYLLIVCYIYFTRIIVYLLQITVPFQDEWLTELFRELATFAVFLVTGYKFQPMNNNPYLQVSQDSDDEIQMDQVLTRTGAAEGLTKVNVRSGNSSNNCSTGPKQRESSHDFD